MESIRLDYPLDSNSIIAICGGYIGDDAEAYSARFGCKLLVFEPVTEYYQKITARFANNPKVHAFNYGLGEASSTERIAVRNDSSSIYRESSDGRYEDISIYDAAMVFSSLPCTEIDLLVCNAEGGEVPVFRRMIDTGTIKMVKYLLAQFHDFFPDAVKQRDLIREGLAKTHDEQWCQPFVWESWSRRQA